MGYSFNKCTPREMFFNIFEEFLSLQLTVQNSYLILYTPLRNHLLHLKKCYI